MCGIVGIVDYRRIPVNNSAVMQAANVLEKRGPDDAGVWVEDNVGFGHRRLAILDLTDVAHQPMSSESGRYVIVYNGEMYNFMELRRQLDTVWRSNSDTEVILSAYEKWGPECVKHFHGMFAFAIWDRLEKKLFAARDRLGVKPFYYHHSDKCFAFASRPGALFELDNGLCGDIDEQALRLYLEGGYFPAPYSIYRTVQKLLPAHFLLVDENGLHMERYWDFRHIAPALDWNDRPEEELLDELEEIVSRSVKSRMISDVPLGAFLSGGIDSSVVVAMMSRHTSQPVKTFTIGFAEKDYDESSHAQEVADHLATEHYSEVMHIDKLVDLMPVFVEQFDEPFFDSSAFPVMAVSRLARQYVTVSLSGDGGDELFGGYHYYQIIQKMHFLYGFPGTFRRLIGSVIGFFPSHQLRLLAGALSQPDIVNAFAFSRSIAKDFPEIINDEVLRRTFGIHELFTLAVKDFYDNLHPSEQGMRLDACFTLPDDYLQKVDVASMAFSLESRDPLLEHDLVEWAMKLPISWKLRNGVNKYLLRKLAYRFVPKEILNRPKRGFAVPIDTWLRGPLNAWAEERLHDKLLFQSIPLNQSSVLNLWDVHQSGKRNAHPLLWAILMLLDFCSRVLVNRHA
ncbi:MAG TPA: asparagine synthase (glutamine-hydrolyzing) [Syntrophales bacterium]|nr:asparagine synthase (glutamine-hydrolyzing) [Syntrophales bacterium]